MELYRSGARSWNRPTKLRVGTAHVPRSYITRYVDNYSDLDLSETWLTSVGLLDSPRRGLTAEFDFDQINDYGF